MYENIEVIITCLIILVVVVLLSYVIFKLNQANLKNSLLLRKDKENTDKLITYQMKLSSLAPSELSFVDKMKHDFKIKEVLHKIANFNSDIEFTSGFLFHNGGHIPTQLSMIYEEKPVGTPKERYMYLFQGIRTCSMYQQILLILDSKCLKMNRINPKENKFCQLLDSCGTVKFLAYAVKYDEKTPVMVIGVHLKKDASIDEILIDEIHKEIESIKPDIIKLFAHKLKYYNEESKFKAN